MITRRTTGWMCLSVLAFGCAAPAGDGAATTAPSPRPVGLRPASETRSSAHPSASTSLAASAASAAPRGYRPPASLRTMPAGMRYREVLIPVDARPSLSMFDVDDLVRPVRDFPGRDMNLTPSGWSPEPEDFGEEAAAVIDAEQLVNLIQNTIDPESWDEEGNSVRYFNGKLIVNRNGNSD